MSNNNPYSVIGTATRDIQQGESITFEDFDTTIPACVNVTDEAHCFCCSCGECKDMRDYCKRVADAQHEERELASNKREARSKRVRDSLGERCIGVVTTGDWMHNAIMAAFDE